jgi:hypothetical protein
MSRKYILPAAMIASLLLVFLGGCTPFGIDVHDRLSMFVTSLNAVDRSTINTQFDTPLVTMIPTLTTAWWNTNFPPPPDPEHAYSVTLLDYVDPANVVATIMGPPLFNGLSGAPLNAVFVMSKEGADWFILRVSLNGTVVIQ